MEAALVSVATGALRPVLWKLTALLGEEYSRFKGAHKAIKSLADELVFMTAFLLKMSEDEDPSELDKVWMTAVRELSYDMEDSIDEFMKKIDDKDTKPDGFIDKIKSSLQKLGKMKTHRGIGEEVKDLKKQVIDVGNMNARYKAREPIYNKKEKSNVQDSVNTVDPRALAIYENASKLVGINKPKSEIIKLLEQEDVRAPVQQQHLKIVSIVGSGGMGKTTLANQVYQEFKVKFKHKAFVSVSRNPDMTNILRTILSEVADEDYANTEAGNIQLLSNIANFLVDKRYFIVIDDIWRTENWDDIKYAFPMSSRGTIITTTRIKDVAESCQSSFGGHIYNIRPLDIVHSRQLFHARLFNSERNCPSHLEEVSDQILIKCDGLPLAIIAISGLLANTERTEYSWNEVKESIGCALERNGTVEGMMKILSLSYFDLPPRLKTCLLYVSIFAEDSFIEKNDLIRRWICEDFIHKEERYTADEIGENCFNELLNRGLIQPLHIDLYGKVGSCRVHDMVLDFIISKAQEENFVTLLGVPILSVRKQSTFVRRLSLHGNSAIPIEELVLSHARSLNVFGTYSENGNSMQIPSLEEFKHLRVLSLGLEHYHQVEDHYLENILRLFQLRYLYIQGKDISKLPKQIGRLECLETLDLRCSNVKELPASIVDLEKMTHLLVNVDVKFPDGIAKMQALDTLKDVGVYIQPFDFVWGLGQLKNLRNLTLNFKVDDDSEYANIVREGHNQGIISSLRKLATQNLRSLTIQSWRRRMLQGPSLSLPTLEELITKWCSAIPQVPEWVSSLSNLQLLTLRVVRVKHDDLCILGALPSLLILDLMGNNTESNEKKLKISGEVGFRFLRVFIYDAGADLVFVAGSMPKLEKLILHYLGPVDVDSLNVKIENLPCLGTFQVCTMYGMPRAVETALERAVIAHPNHPCLILKEASKTNVTSRLSMAGWSTRLGRFPPVN